MQQAFEKQQEQTKAIGAARAKNSFGGSAILSLAIALVGGAAAGAALVAASPQVKPLGTAEQPLIEQINLADLDQAADTLDPASKDEILRKAKACEAPIFMMRISGTSAQARGNVRIKSGAYISPLFAVSSAPQSVAVPAPVPYEIGKGNMEILGDAKDARIEMTPHVDLSTLSGSFVQSVWWPIDKKCAQ